MLHLILLGGTAALIHAALAYLPWRTQASARPPTWLRIAWAGLLVVVAAISTSRADALPTGPGEALRVLWVVPVVDVIVLLAVLGVRNGHRDAAAPVVDRRRLLLGVLTTGAVTAGAVFAGRPAAAPGGIARTAGHKVPAAIDPLANGAAADYTGRFGTPGEGTDSRAGIQAALDAATDVVGTDYYDYINRRSTTVTLPPGHYLISSPEEDASLVIPAGVVLDASDATLYFDYPSTPRSSWCGIRVGQFGQLKLGKLYPSGRAAAPDPELVYDAVRLVQTDDNTRVMGYGDSEIRGWQGAAVRGVGAWLVFVKGLRIADNAYGYVASRTGDGTLGYALSVPPDGGTVRNHTDLRFEDCFFVNLSHGGIVGAVLGDAGRLHTPDLESLSLTVGLVGCVFENIAGYALDITSAMVVTAHDCGFEEVGVTDRGMIRLDNCRSASFTSTRVNLAGRPVPGPTGPTRPFPAYVFEVTTTESLVVDGMHAFNSLNPAMQLANGEPSVNWRIGNISASGALAPGPMYAAAGTVALSGRWDNGHLVLGSHHLWVDRSGALRHKNGPPTADTDGGVIP